MKKTMLTAAILVSLASSVLAVQEVPSFRVSFPTSATYYAISATSDVAEEAIIDYGKVRIDVCYAETPKLRLFWRDHERK